MVAFHFWALFYPMSGNRLRCNVQNCVGLKTLETPEWSTERELSGDKDPVSKQYTEVPISPYPDQEGNKLQRQKILILIYSIYNHNWRNISNIYIYIYIL